MDAPIAIEETEERQLLLREIVGATGAIRPDGSARPSRSASDR